LKVRIDENRTFGVELEFILPHRVATLATRLNAVNITCYSEHYNHYTRDYWKIVSDATVHSETGYTPMELVSPPLRGLDGLRQLETVCMVLNELNAKVNRSCGLHVHHDARNLELQEWKSIVKSYIKYEDTIDLLMAPSRRGNGNQWSRSLKGSYAGYTVNELWARVDRSYDVYNLQQMFGTRYIKLNLEASTLHGTVEYRQHGGTTNFTKIAAWVALTQGFVTSAVQGKPVRGKLPKKGSALASLMRRTGLVTTDVHKFYEARYDAAGGEA
jgi:hypothetical protein